MSLLSTERAHDKLILSTLILANVLFIDSCAVTRCGDLKLQKVAKPRIVVSNNRCSEPEMAIDSIVNLQAETGIRLLSSSSRSGSSLQQVICRNQSSYPMKIRVISASSPWIRPEQDRIHCNKWVNDRLECTETRTNQTVLVCALSQSTNTIAMRGTSTMPPPKMRGSQSEEDNVMTEMKLQEVDNLLERDIKPKIDQCRKDFSSDQKLKLTWTIKSNGVVRMQESYSDDKFVSCVIDAMEDYLFPQYQNDITITHAL